MSPSEEQARAARQLMAAQLHGMLSTHSLEHPGYPFGSLVPYVLDYDGLPLFLLSHLSLHTRNLQQDARCGLMIAQQGAGDVQQLARLSAVGDVREIDAGSAGARYFRYFPQTRVYFEQLGFRFFRFDPLHFHWNGGFATARWFGNDRIVRPNPFGAATELSAIETLTMQPPAWLQAHLNERRPATASGRPTIVGIDAEGIDVRSADDLMRIALAHRVETLDELRTLSSAE